MDNTIDTQMQTDKARSQDKEERGLMLEPVEFCRKMKGKGQAVRAKSNPKRQEGQNEVLERIQEFCNCTKWWTTLPQPAPSPRSSGTASQQDGTVRSV